MSSPVVRPDHVTFSWLQSRQTNLRAGTEQELRRLSSMGFEHVELDHFYDIQVTRRRHVSRFLLDGLELEIDRGGRRLRGPASLSLVFWHVGYYCLRLTLEGLEGDQGLDATDLHELHAAEHEADSGFAVRGRTGIGEFELAGNVRRVFDWFGCYVHEVLSGRTPQHSQLDTWSASCEAGLERRDLYVRRGELTGVYPSTFGSHAELCWTDARKIPDRPERWAAGLLAETREGERHAYDIDAESNSRWWFLSEFQSVLVRGATSGLDMSLRTVDTARAQMIEYLALRRGALAAIQRQTQLAAAERRPVARREVSDWTWFLNAVTDDYVVGGWSAGMLEQIKRVLRDSHSLRDVFDLENQVRRNVDAFQQRLDAESDRTGIMLAVFFGIVAATSLLPLAQFLYSNMSGLEVDDYATFPVAHPEAFLVLSVVLLLVVGGVAAALLLRSRYLRPPQRRRRTVWRPTARAARPRARSRG